MEQFNILLYNKPEGNVNVSVYFREGTFWLSQKSIAELFGSERSVLTKHLKKIFDSGELEENSVCANFAHTASDGKNHQTKAK